MTIEQLYELLDRRPPYDPDIVHMIYYLDTLKLKWLRFYSHGFSSSLVLIICIK